MWRHLCLLLLPIFPALSQDFPFVAAEGNRFKVDGTEVVRYGAQPSWVEKTVAGAGECPNRFSGRDPLTGVAKSCALVESRVSVLAKTPPLTRQAPSLPATWGSPRSRARIFLSGHSLTDDPYAEQVVRIANSLGNSNTAKFNQQIVIGSPIRGRTGLPRNLNGYSSGKNNPSSSEGLNVLDEFQSGRTIGGERYDTLVITENHNLIEMLEWENTVRQLRHFHDRLVEANPEARTFLHSSWWGIDKSKPQVWLKAERSIAMGWQCIGSRINKSLELAGRKDRVLPLPMSLALAHLVEQVISGGHAAIGSKSAREGLDVIFGDNVHLGLTGVYYASLVTYSALFERAPIGAWHPPELGSQQARFLQNLAWDFVSDFYGKYQEPAVEACTSTHMARVCDSYWSLRNQPENIPGCQKLYEPSNPNNPLRFVRSEEPRFWFRARPY